MRKLMILSLIAVILGVGFVLAQQEALRLVTIAEAVANTNSAGSSLAEIAARGEVTVHYTTAEDNYQFTEATLAELSAQGFVNIWTTHEYDFTCGTSPELRELSAQGVVTVKPSNTLCTA